METNDPGASIKESTIALASASFPFLCGYIYDFKLSLYDRPYPTFCVVCTTYNKLSHVQRKMKICIFNDTRVGKNISIYYFQLELFTLNLYSFEYCTWVNIAT